MAHVWGGDQVDECFLLTLGPSDKEQALTVRLKRFFSLAVSPYSRTLCSAAAGQLHGENLLLLRGGREGP